ncbi:MAG: benzoate/H(+) symporter BenE family transporter, partial [Burkholderiales bacterium]|nr:benzoate/H(+) symporter BenE family transporter [Burkholderiales bacterium]
MLGRADQLVQEDRITEVGNEATHDGFSVPLRRFSPAYRPPPPRPARALGASPAQTASWMVALGLAMGLSSIVLSLRYRQPVLAAWSTPGAALLAATQGVGLPEATGAFLFSAALVIAAGASGWFERVMDKLPMAIAAALLAGVLARFGLEAVLAARGAPGLVLAMAAAFLLGRRWWPRYAIPGVLAVGIVVAAAQGQIALQGAALRWSAPVFTAPSWSLAALVSVGLPLFIVTMASQNLPGVAAQRAAGYATPVSPVITATGVVSLLSAPFGGYVINL